ncbi:MAG: twin transmembrane helix small protein [Burkholderiales bacterium]|nr:twin transmembrane helix small protein [Burkholderiales bacterium]
MKIVVVLLMLFIAASLLSAGFFLVRDQGKSDRTVRALTVRIVLSWCVFALLMLGHYFGLIGERLG